MEDADSLESPNVNTETGTNQVLRNSDRKPLRYEAVSTDSLFKVFLESIQTPDSE
jgi:hypothetical protein